MYLANTQNSQNRHSIELNRTGAVKAGHGVDITSTACNTEIYTQKSQKLFDSVNFRIFHWKTLENENNYIWSAFFRNGV